MSWREPVHNGLLRGLLRKNHYNGLLRKCRKNGYWAQKAKSKHHWTNAQLYQQMRGLDISTRGRKRDRSAVSRIRLTVYGWTSLRRCPTVSSTVFRRPPVVARIRLSRAGWVACSLGCEGTQQYLQQYSGDSPFV